MNVETSLEILEGLDFHAGLACEHIRHEKEHPPMPAAWWRKSWGPCGHVTEKPVCDFEHWRWLSVSKSFPVICRICNAVTSKQHHTVIDTRLEDQP